MLNITETTRSVKVFNGEKEVSNTMGRKTAITGESQEVQDYIQGKYISYLLKYKSAKYLADHFHAGHFIFA